MSDLAWIHASLTSARPQAVAALLRYFRDLDRAEEAFQEACLRAFKFIDSFHGGNSRAWLLAIVRNTYYTWLEKNRTEHMDSLLPPPLIRVDHPQGTER